MLDKTSFDSPRVQFVSTKEKVMKRYKVTYYRTLICEGEIEADTLSEVKEKAEDEVSDMLDTDFDQVYKEAVKIEQNGVQICTTTVLSCWT